MNLFVRVAATALFVVGLGLVLAAAGLVVQPYAGLPRLFAVPLIVAGMLAWAVAGGVMLAHSGRDDPYSPRHHD